MSLKSKAIWAPAPGTERGRPTQLSADSKGERLAYANGKSVFLRSIDEPSRSTQYTGHNANTTVARFSPSGFYVASGDASGMVRVWDCQGEGATKGEYHINRSISDLAWDGDSQRIIAVGDGKERFGHCITADSGNSVGEISGHSAPINSVAIRQQRPIRAVTGSDDMSLVFYQGPPFKFNTSLRGQHSRFVYGVAFSPDGANIVSVGADKKIWLFDGKTGEAKNQIGGEEHKGSIFSVAWSPDSKNVVTASADQTVKIWDIEAGKSIQSWRLGPETVSIPHHQVGVVWPNRSDKLILSLSLSGAINYLTQGEASPRTVIYGHQKSITAFTRDESSPPTLWSGGSEGQVLHWQSENGVAKPVEGETHKNYVSALAAGPDGGVLSVGWDDILRHIDGKTGIFSGNNVSTDGQPRGVALLDGKWIVGTHKGVEVYNPPGAKASTTTTNFSTTCLGASARSSLLALGADDSHIRIYRLAGDKLNLEREIKELTSQPTAVAFSHDGSTLAVGFASGKIVGYDTKSWDATITRWSAHNGRITSISWRRDDQFAASASLDTNVFVWSVEKPGRRISAGNAHKESVNGVRWLDDSTIATAGADGAVKTWTVEGL